MVVGSGPAGFAVVACLRQAGIEFVLLEKEQALAPSWRRHYDRLHLHTDRNHSGLPYLPVPRSYPRYPSRAQLVEYLEAHANAFSIAPRFGEDVAEARRGDGAWELKTQAARYRARALVLATGYNAVPVRPHWPGMESYKGVLLHSSEYRSAGCLLGQDVLVVGVWQLGRGDCHRLVLDLLHSDLVRRPTWAWLESPDHRQLLSCFRIYRPLGAIKDPLRSTEGGPRGAPSSREYFHAEAMNCTAHGRPKSRTSSLTDLGFWV